MSDIRNWDAFKRGRWSWTSCGYEQGFKPRCQFSDIDAIVEFDGRMLLIEAKDYRGEGPIPTISTGQRLLLERIAQLDKTTVLVLFGHGPTNDPYVVWDIGRKERHDYRGWPQDVRRDGLKWHIDRAMAVGVCAGAAS